MIIYTCKLTFFALNWRISGGSWAVTSSITYCRRSPPSRLIAGISAMT